MGAVIPERLIISLFQLLNQRIEGLTVTVCNLWVEAT